MHRNLNSIEPAIIAQSIQGHDLLRDMAFTVPELNVIYEFLALCVSVIHLYHVCNNLWVFKLLMVE